MSQENESRRFLLILWSFIHHCFLATCPFSEAPLFRPLSDPTIPYWSWLYPSPYLPYHRWFINELRKFSDYWKIGTKELWRNCSPPVFWPKERWLPFLLFLPLYWNEAKVSQSCLAMQIGARVCAAVIRWWGFKTCIAASQLRAIVSASLSESPHVVHLSFTNS